MTNIWVAVFMVHARNRTGASQLFGAGQRRVRVVHHRERSGFVVMKLSAIGGGVALGRGFEG
jgi:hypothetical protein